MQARCFPAVCDAAQSGFMFQSSEEASALKVTGFIDDDLARRAMRLAPGMSLPEVINLALSEFVSRRSQRKILGLVGKIDWDPECDYKSMRSRD